MQYEIITYEVWGNDREGFEVNDCRSTGDYVVITDDMSDRDIVQQLKQAGYIRKGCRYANFSIEGDPDYSFYVTCEPIMYPVCELRRVED